MSTANIERGEPVQEASNAAAATTSNDEARVKARRKQIRGKITRAINRLSYIIDGDEQNPRRITRILTEIKNDYSTACNIYSELYSYVEDDQTDRLDQWENDLSKEVYDLEDKVEDYLSALTLNSKGQQDSQQRTVTRATTSQRTEHTDTGSSTSGQEMHSTVQPGADNLPPSETTPSASLNASLSAEPNERAPMGQSFDSWIDNLIEFKETVLLLNNSNRKMSVSEALFKLEASKDIPTISLGKYNGDPLGYVDFVEKFKIHIHDKVHLNDDTRMVQLRMHLTGEAERAISGLGCSGVMYATAMKTLKDQFGQRSTIARACLKGLTSGAKIGAKDRQGLRDFSLDIINAISIFQRIGYQSDVNASESLRQIIRRLPDFMIGKWKGVVTEIREKGDVPNIQQVSAFIRKQVKSEFDPDFGDLFGPTYTKPEVRERKKGIHSAQPKSKGLKCYVCEEEHRVAECPNFKYAPVKERVKVAQNLRLCFSCLTKGHMLKDCRSKKQCSKNGCSYSHHALLHVDSSPASGVATILDSDGILPVVRVRFRAPSGKVREGNVLIDSGAGTTVIRQEFAKSLGLQGKKERFDLSVVGGETLRQPNSRRVKLWISNLNGGEEHAIEAHEIDKTILSVPALNRQTLKSYSHLADVNFAHKAGPVDLILGVQYSHLHVDEEVRQGLPFEPVGKRSRLGWYVIGSDTGKKHSSVCTIGFMQKIDMEKFYDCETIGVRAPDCDCPVKAISYEDRNVLRMFEQSCTKVGDRYVIGLPWKRDPADLPDNYPLAEKRLYCLERSLLKDKQKAEMYNRAVHEYIDNGWAEPLVDDQVSDVHPVYYLPHHGIYRPEKKSTPLRVVFDPACEYKGMCLNSFLHKGPCLIGNLLGVLLRFREQEVAFIGDISKMYLQICIPESDTQVHWFLWRDMDVSKQPNVYRLMRVAFGDKPSPDMASFVMMRIAQETRAEYPLAAEILERDRYVDDLIHSCGTKQEAKESMNQLNLALARGSFKVKQWYCSGDTQYEQVSSGNEAVDTGQQNTVVKLDQEETVKALGVVWNSDQDEIRFMIKDVEFDKFTKRNVLSRVSGIYDPMGLASPVTIKARIALQDIWRSKDLDWDDELPADMADVWKNIFLDLENLREVRLPRSVKPLGAIGEAELHVFSDASVLAYGAVAFLCWPTSVCPEVRLVSAKARVAPLRQCTVPRLELMLALVASRLAKTVFDEFKEKPAHVTLWTDSQIVLHWLKAESITLKAFVGVRVAEIQATWKPEQWRYVPTKENPADQLTGVLRRKGWIGGSLVLLSCERPKSSGRKPFPQWPALTNQKSKGQSL